MRRDVYILLGTVAIAGLAEWGPTVPAALADMETFRLRDVEVRGARFLTKETVVTQLELAPEMSVWTDLGALRDRLLDHPLVLDAEVTRRPPHELLVTIAERQPIALAPTPTLEPLDAEGRRLPLDPALHRLDLPIIAVSRTPPEGARVFPEDVRVLAAELEHLMNVDTAFMHGVSSVRLDERGAIIARWTEPEVEFVLPPRASPARLREGLGALSDAISRTPGEVPEQIDLRFADQVVVRRGS